jgi:hemerythrin superfamily protein
MRIHNKNVNTGVLAGGILVGAVASRLLPPLFANVNGSVRAKLGADPFQLLEEDHRSMELLLEKLRTSSDDSLAARTVAFMSLKRKIGKHALAEEDVVYPLLHEHANAQEDAYRLYREHAEMKIHLYELEAALKKNGEWKERFQSFDYLIREHIRDEEEKEFPRLREMMNEKQSICLSGLIRREESLVL